MCRRLILTAVLLALTAGLAVAKSGGGTRTEDRWNPQHIDSLPLHGFDLSD